MADLYPTFDILDDIDEQQAEQEQTQYKISVFFDFTKGDFVLDEQGRLKTATEAEAWEQWCIKTIQTQRYAFMSYSDNYGVELEEIFSETSKAIKEAMIENSISEALLADPYGRTAYIKDFSFKWQTDSVIISLTIVGTENQERGVTIELQGGE